MTIVVTIKSETAMLYNVNYSFHFNFSSKFIFFCGERVDSAKL